MLSSNGDDHGRGEALAAVEAAAHGFAAALKHAGEVGVGAAVLIPVILRVLDEEGIELPPMAAGMLSGLTS